MTALSRAIRRPLAFVRSAFTSFLAHDPFQAAAALSYYSLFSLAPLVIVIASIGGIFFSDAEIQAALIERIRGNLSEDAAALVETVIANSTNVERNVVSLIIASILILIGATTALAQLQQVLNRIWNIRAAGRLRVWHVVKGRLLSFAFLVAISMLLAASLLFNTFLAAFVEFLGRYVAIDATVLRSLDLATSYIATAIMLVLIYKILPDTRVRWRDAALGALVATVLFEGSKFVVRVYLAQVRPESSFGASGSMVIFLLWIYVASLIIQIGAEIGQTAWAAAQEPESPGEPDAT